MKYNYKPGDIVVLIEDYGNLPIGEKLKLIDKWSNGWNFEILNTGKIGSCFTSRFMPESDEESQKSEIKIERIPNKLIERLIHFKRL